MTAPAVRVGSGRLGRGVFAARAVARGEIVEVCPTLEVHEDDVSGTLGDYVFSSNDDAQAVVLALGFGMLYNHSHESNVEYREHDPGTIAFVTTRDVRRGEELTIDYGREWWDTRGLQPK